ncbi:glycosyltransferase [Aquicoccus sp. SCR17]|nr:glycosyltransferase [Carideicomes alvinocaridis]
MSVVVVNWNARDVLYDCLMSIMQQTTMPHEVIVVDNNSTDGSPEMVREAFPDVVLVANSENRGFAAANNQGLRLSRGKRLLLLNPDTVILEHAIDRVASWLDAHPDVGCVGCQVMENREQVQRTCFADLGPVNVALVEFGLHRLAPQNRFLGKPEYAGWGRDTQRDVDVVSGMFMMVPRHVFDEVGELDESFFIYSEEADWCRRIRRAGWRCVFTPEAQIIHLDGGSKSTAQIRSRMYIQMQKSKLIYLRKHYGVRGYVLGRLIFLVSSMLRFLLTTGRNGSEEISARRRLALAALRYHVTGQEPVS